jgi:hypothetical protein
LGFIIKTIEMNSQRFGDISSITGYHRIGNRLIHITPRGLLVGGVVIGGIYSWRLYGMCRAMFHDRLYPNEPKQVQASMFITQMGIEAVFTSLLFPFISGALKYNGPVPIPEHMKKQSIFRTARKSTNSPIVELSTMKKDFKATVNFSVQRQHMMQVLKSIKIF